MARPKKEIHLQLSPSSAITFQGDFTAKVSKANLTLFNPTSTTVAYKVKTTAPRRYCVRPNSGKIISNDQATVNIMLQPSQNNEDLNKHKFMVQTIEVADDHNLEANSVEDLFKNTPTSEVTSKKLIWQFEKEREVNVVEKKREVADEENLVIERQKAKTTREAEENANILTQPEILNNDTERQLINRNVKICKDEMEDTEHADRELPPTYDETNQKIVMANNTKTVTNTLQDKNLMNQPRVITHVAEPKLINPEMSDIVKSDFVKEDNLNRPQAADKTSQNTKQPAKVARVENTSKFTTISFEELEQLRETIKALKKDEHKTKNIPAENSIETKLTSHALDNNTTFYKALIIIAVMSFILGWLLSSMLCKC